MGTQAFWEARPVGIGTDESWTLFVQCANGLRLAIPAFLTEEEASDEGQRLIDENPRGAVG